MRTDFLLEALPQYRATEVLSNFSYIDSMLWHMLCYCLSVRFGRDLVQPANEAESQQFRNIDGGG